MNCWRGFLRAAGVGAALTALQACMIYSWQCQNPRDGSDRSVGVGDFYRMMARHDSAWYAHIIKNGYKSEVPPVAQQPDRANVAFFPGFPVMAGAFSRATGIETDLSLVLTAQIFCLVFWVAFAAAVGQFLSAPNSVFLVGCIVAAQPAGFFLQAGYSESLFMASLFVFLLAAGTRRMGAGVAAAGATAGFVMTATRIVGIPLVAIALVRGGGKDWRWRVAMATLSLGGGALFFALCQIWWGEWDIYMQTQNIGWGITPNPAAIFDRESWTGWGLLRDWGNPSPFAVDRFSVGLSLWSSCATVLLEFIARRAGVGGLKSRSPYYLAAACLLLVSMSGLHSVGYRSMLRYSLPACAAWVVGLSGLGTEWNRKNPIVGYAFAGAGILFGAAGLFVQSRLARTFMDGGWVA